MKKQELIDLIKKLPDDIEVFNYTSALDDDCKMMDIRISLEPREKEFYDWYFGM